MENNIKITQNNNTIIQTTKTICWLVDNTKVDTFDPVTFSGYQRKIDDNHCNKIVDYIIDSVNKKEFYMPNPIICSSRSSYNNDAELYVVDGQHRINAFRLLKEENLNIFNCIKDIEFPIIVMEKPDMLLEISTFITINKTSKKVDTSLAIVLKNKLNQDKCSSDISISKREYIAVEAAWKLNDNTDSIFYDNILFEGPLKKSGKMLTLNSFVKSVKKIIHALEKKKYISINWTDESDVDKLVSTINDLLEYIWTKNIGITVSYENGKYIRSIIGFNVINKIITHFIITSKNDVLDYDDLCSIIDKCLNVVLSETNFWNSSDLSMYSSEAGYKILSSQLIQKI